MATVVTALSGAPIKMSGEALQELAAQLPGPAAWRAAPGPDAPPERKPFKAMHRGTPVVRIECAGPPDDHNIVPAT